jgi:hypothetical protein
MFVQWDIAFAIYRNDKVPREYEYSIVDELGTTIKPVTLFKMFANHNYFQLRLGMQLTVCTFRTIWN